MQAPALSKDLRSLLERTVRAARVAAEAGALAALDRLAVGEAKPYDHLSEADRALRNDLRARGRAAGDGRNSDGTQDTDHLAREVAYEHWHTLLFARFLAAKGVLMHPEGVAVSLEDCAELAAEEHAPDAYALAARYAARMLPAIFRPDDPALRLPFAPEHRLALVALVERLPEAVFAAWDSLGWVYQFWQADAKDRANKGGKKIDADTLPAVTQLFTEGYMVDFLLHNTLGAWWAARHPNPAGEREANDPLPVAMPYLRRNDDGTPAAGTFAAWPARVADLRLLDPSCGSGHFLVAALGLLVPMRMAEGNLDARAACDAVLRDSLHGLELDPRCTQIAAFNLALAAWTYPGAGGYRELPKLNVACSGLAPTATKAEWRRLAGGDARLAQALDLLHERFQDAPTLGSLLDPTEGADLVTAAFDDTLPRLVQALERGHSLFAGEDAAEGVVAQGLAEAARILAGRYHLVVTNVPYLGRGNQDDVLKAFADRHYPAARADLATVFTERCLELCTKGGTAALVTPQNWLFLGSYTGFRQRLLRDRTFDVLALLGTGAFGAINGWVVNIGLFVLTRVRAEKEHRFIGLDVQAMHSPEVKAAALTAEETRHVRQGSQLDNPDARISLDDVGFASLLSAYASGLQGMATADYPRFGRFLWEVALDQSRWTYQQSTVEETKPLDGKHYVVLWEGGRGALASSPQARIQGLDAMSKWGVAVSQMASLPVTLHTGGLFDNNTAVILPHDPAHLPAIWAFCSSPEYAVAVRRIDQALKVTNASLVKVPFDFERWTKVAEEQYPNGLPEPRSDDPTQWLFEGAVATSEDPLQVAVARLVGYRWPAQYEADGTPKPDPLDAFADADGVVPLVPVRGEPPAEDRLRALLAQSYGDRFSVAALDGLLARSGHAGKTLGEWLRDGFFADHLKRFGQRPFVWHVWDGRKDGFGALVHYHRLDRALLEKLAYGYLGDWITAQADADAKGTPGADARLAAARDLQRRLALILEGEPPYDVFVRWKPAHEQPIGWAPDLNDGVRLNVRPFVEADVLRKRPTVKWEKDRGANPDGAPWGPDRHNRYEDLDDAHKLRGPDGKVLPRLTNDARRYARRQAGLDA